MKKEKTGIMGQTLLLGIIMIFLSSAAYALPVDLNTFNAPVGNVSVNASGTLATFTESADFGPISLENFALSIPAGTTNLSFNYQLTVAANNEDYFDFYFNNLSTPVFPVGGVQEGVISGTYSLDISSFAGSSVAMIFSFMYGGNDQGYDSILTVSNVDIGVQTTPVPEPGTLLLFGTGLLGLTWVRRLIKS